MKTKNHLKLKLSEKKAIDLPVIRGTEGQPGIDINQLRKKAKYVTFDNGFANTASCLSNITYVDGEKGELRYRGYARNSVTTFSKGKIFPIPCLILQRNLSTMH